MEDKDKENNEKEKVYSKNERKRIITIIIIILLVIFLMITLLILISKRTSLFPRAKEISSSYQKDVSLQNSYIFASPVRVTTGVESARVTVFILDSSGMGIYDKTVILGNNQGAVEIRNLQQITDETGKALFDISSDQKGTYFIEASVDGNILPSKAKVVFE